MDFSLRHISDQTFSFNPLAIDIMVYRLFMAVFFSAIIFGIYYFLSRKFKKSGENTFIILMASPIICLILLGIGSSVPRAFGLFAALSIIRLRTPIKDTSDMVFIFISVALGICCGAGAVNVAFVGTLFFIVATFFYSTFLIYRRRTEYYCMEVETCLSSTDQLHESLFGNNKVEAEFLNKRQVGQKAYLNYFFSANPAALLEIESTMKKNSEITQYTIEKQVSVNSFS